MISIIDRDWPTDHAFIEEVLAKRKGMEDIENTIICLSNKNAKKEQVWHKSSLVVLEKRHNIIDTINMYMTAKHCDDYEESKVMYVRNRLLLALLFHFFSNKKVIYHISHLKAETRKYIEENRRSSLLRKEIYILLISIYIWVRNGLISRIQEVWLVSERTAQELNKRYDMDRNFGIIPLGADENFCTEQKRAKCMKDKNVPRLIYVGTLNRFRNVAIFVKMVRKVVSAGQNVELVLLGKGRSKKDTKVIKNTVKNNDVSEHVSIRGEVPRTKVADEICKSDVGLSHFPSEWVFQINSPMKVMEYISCGVPVLCSNQEQQKQIVEKCDAGVVVNEPTPKKYANALLDVLTNRYNESKMRSKLLSLKSYTKIGKTCSQKIGKYI
jgi:glycosyltransferase involved in cell wall biosynthesis